MRRPALEHVPHRLLCLGVGRGELHRYGTVAQHDAAHGLDAAELRRSIAGWVAERGSRGRVRLLS